MAERLLIVEGETSLGDEIAPVLAGAGFNVEQVAGGPVTLPKLDGLKPDLIILDEALNSSMENCYEYTAAGIPVILVGEDPSDDIWRRAIHEAGAEFYLRKPICHEVLVARVKAILRRYRRREE
jgi:DNA-binding response OmpR family regulator